MTADQFARARQIFLEALDRPEADRRPFVEQACAGDQELQREVIDLLAAHLPTLEPSSPPFSATDGPHVLEQPETVQFRNNQPRREKNPGTAKSARDLPPGTQIADRYRIVSRLGEGGMGEVFRADDLTLDQAVAIKFLPRAVANNPAWIARLRQEARLARTVTDANICRVHDLVSWNGEHFLTMEYVDGEDLATLYRRIGRLPVDRALEVARQICMGLAVAHQKGVLHRDLKPPNIMIDGQGRVRITDFGVAALAGEVPEHDIRTGTAAYMAPEQISGRNVSVKSDIYSLGLVLYELFTGRPAFQAGSVSEYALLHQETSPMAPGQVVDDIPPDVERIILQCLEKDPAARPPSAMHVAAALPGVNVLSAVTAANLTPPPEIVALAQVSPPRVSRFILFAMTLLLIASTWWLRTTSETRWDGLGNLPPAALCERARTLLDSMPDSAGHSYNAFGYAGLRDAMMFVVASAPRDVALTTATVHSEHPVFWYRESPQPLAAMGAARLIRGSGRPSFDDPPHLAGSQTVFYDMDGKLLAFVRAPVWRTPEMQTPEPSAYLESLWRASGVMNARPMVDSSDRAESLSSGGFQVWRGQLNGTGKPSNVAAITTGSNPVWFARLPGSEPSSPVSKYYPHWLRQAVVAGSIQSLFLFVMVIALPWAWRGYWSGRIDRDGAVRLALLVIVLDFLPSLLGVGHSVTPGNELFRLWIASLRALGLGAAVAILFVVVDFLTRRYWPDVLITWNRLLRLQYRDADVRRHFAVGIAVGCLWACLSGVERLLVERIGWNVRPYLFGDRVVEKLYGLRDAAASLIEIIPEAIITGLLFLLLLILMRILVRNPRVAIGLTALILVPVIVPRGAHILTSWLFLGVGGLGIFLALLTRLGLLASVVGFFVVAVLNTSPLASSLNIWYADVTLLALGSIMALAIFGAVGSGARS